MKTTSLLVSMLFSSLAVAAPVMMRDLRTKTSTVVQTEVVYTTVYDGDVPESTSSAAAFFEGPTNVPVAAPTTSSAPAPAPTTVETSATPTPTTTPPAVVPSSSSSSSSSSSASSSSPVAPTTTAPAVVPTTTQAPTTTAAPVAPTSAPVAEAAAPTAPSSGSGSGSTGTVHTGGSMTLNYFNGGLGSCGKPVADTEMAVALASDLYGASTYDVATGNPTNVWCGQKVAITYKGKTTTATIMDKCPGCTNGGFDMTPAVWEAVTGTSVGDRLTGMTWTTI